MVSSKLTPEMAEEMRQDAASEERRKAFASSRVTAADSLEENLEALFRLLEELRPLLGSEPPRREVTKGGRFLL